MVGYLQGVSSTSDEDSTFQVFTGEGEGGVGERGRRGEGLSCIECTRVEGRYCMHMVTWCSDQHKEQVNYNSRITVRKVSPPLPSIHTPAAYMDLYLR